jgi:hypothetical protein
MKMNEGLGFNQSTLERCYTLLINQQASIVKESFDQFLSV